jgi:hypothetical protein
MSRKLITRITIGRLLSAQILGPVRCMGWNGEFPVNSQWGGSASGSHGSNENLTVESHCRVACWTCGVVGGPRQRSLEEERGRGKKLFDRTRSSFGCNFIKKIPGGYYSVLGGYLLWAVKNLRFLTGTGSLVRLQMSVRTGSEQGQIGTGTGIGHFQNRNWYWNRR